MSLTISVNDDGNGDDATNDASTGCFENSKILLRWKKKERLLWDEEEKNLITIERSKKEKEFFVNKKVISNLDEFCRCRTLADPMLFAPCCGDGIEKF